MEIKDGGALISILDGFVNQKRAQTDNVSVSVLSDLLVEAIPDIDLAQYSTLRDFKKDELNFKKFRKDPYNFFEVNPVIALEVAKGLVELKYGMSNIAVLSGIDITDSTTITKDTIAKAGRLSTMAGYLGFLVGRYNSPVEFTNIERLNQQQ